MVSITQNQLTQITNAIKQLANPKQIILFGSQARGTANEQSDVDVMVVGERDPGLGWSRRREIGRIRRSIPPIGMPIDVIFFTPKEINRWKDTTNHVISEALKEGKVLYERP